MTQITVIISTWCVPFDQVVQSITTFQTADTALAAINAASAAWWAENDGARCMVEMPDTLPYEPVAELGYNHARYVLWGGETGFHAMLDRATYATLNEAHYEREFTDKGMALPGYLQVTKLQGNWPE